MYYFKIDHRPDYTLPFAIDSHTLGEFKGQITCFSPHNHDVLELLMVTGGKLQTIINGHSYTLLPGDVAIANPFEIHQGECDCNGTEYLGITTNLKKILPYSQTSLTPAISDLLSGKSRFDSFLHRDQESTQQLYRAFVRLQDALQDKSPQGECISASLVFEVFSILFREHYREENLSLRGKQDLTFSRNVSQYLYENYTRDISTRTICDHLYMEMPQFCRKFREHFGSNFSNYLCMYRITNAANLYRGSELPISQIAINVGFSDYCYFSKSFKKYVGQTPAVYFRKWKTSATMD